jgi:hypothetical protein
MKSLVSAIAAWLFVVLFSYNCKAQWITTQTPSQTDFCTNQTINFSTTPAQPGTFFEWVLEEYNTSFSGSGGNVIPLGSNPQIALSSLDFRPCAILRLITYDVNTLNIINSDSRRISCSVGNPTIPIIFTQIYSSGCGELMVPPPLDPVGSTGNRWAMWYKNGVATGFSGFFLGNLTDSAWYEYKVRLSCGDTITTGLYYFPRPSAPQISAGGPLSICTGDSVTLTASTTVTIDTWLKDGVSIAGTSGKTTIKAGQSGVYVARGKYSSGSGSNCLILSNQISVTVNPGAFITGANQACGGDSVQLSCTAANSYQWRRNGVNIAGATSQSIWVKTSGNYTVNTSGLTCNASPAKVFTSYPVPSSLSLSPSGTITLCDGNTAGISISGNNITSWQWQRNGVNQDSTNSPSIIATRTGTYRCIASNAIGCSRTSQAVQLVSASTSALPQKTLVLQPGSEGIDSYTTSAFGNFISNFGNTGTMEISNWFKYFRNAERGFMNFDLSQIPDQSAIVSANLRLWIDTIAVKNVNANFPNSLNFRRITQNWSETTVSWNNTPSWTNFQAVIVPCSTISSNTFLNTSITNLVRHWIGVPSQKFGLTLQLGESNQQLTWLSIASSDTVAASYRPRLSITYYAADINASGITNLCSGGSVTFTTNAGPYTYQWFRNGNPINNATGISYTATTNGDYYVVLTAASGCTARSLARKVTIGGLPQINLSPSADSIISCSGYATTLRADSLSGYTFQWQKNNVNIAGAVFSSYKPTSSGWYKIRTTSNCGIVGRDSIYVTWVNNPVPVITAGGPTTFCQGQNVVLTSTTYAGATTRWFRGSTLVSTSTNYTASVAGAYSVTQTANGCNKSSNTINVVINCREGSFSQTNQELIMYPVPAQDYCILDLRNFDQMQGVEAVLCDIRGMEISRQAVEEGENTLLLDGVSDGMYLVRIIKGSQLLAAKRLLVQR